jgi:dihydrofolate synthase/folylpolyglutamate synthase
MDLASLGQVPSPEIDYLYGLRRGETRLGLASTRRLFALLGHPERSAPMAHVAGTNGKGSTTALIAAMLQAGRMRVGRFTSPHVLSVEERITVDGHPIDPETLRQRVRDLRPAIERSGASFFEAITAIAALHFRDAGVQAAVYEVGLGGRLDATNVIPSTVAVLTSVGHDHEAILGRGLRAVCREKLGIVKRGVRLVAALDRADLVRLARDTCARRRAPLTLLPSDAGRVLDVDLAAGTRIELRTPFPVQLVTPFLGAHQVRNVALAAHAVAEMHSRGVLDRPPDVVEGAARAFLPGRFQVLPAWKDDPTVVLDVGHNPEALQATLDIAGAVLGGTRTVVVLGLLRDKKLGPAARQLARFADEVVLTAPRVERAWNPRAGLRLLPRGRVYARRTVLPDVAAALDHALGSGAGAVLIVGSHFLLGEAVPWLAARRGLPPAALLLPPRLERPLRRASSSSESPTIR